MSIFKELIKAEEQDFYLRNTTYLMRIPEQKFREELTALYNSKDELHKALATLLNAIFTDGKPTFYLSFRSFEHLLNNDKNLSYKGRTGIATTIYKKLYSRLSYYFADSASFEVVEWASKETRTPSCIALVSEETLLSMGNQMMIKLASNWHQMAIKTLSNLHKCYEITEQSQKAHHILDTNTNTSSTNTRTLRSEGASVDSNDSFKDENLTPYKVKTSPWYQHYLKSSIIEQKFNSFPESLKRQAVAIVDKDDFVSFVNENTPKTFRYEDPLALLKAKLG